MYMKLIYSFTAGAKLVIRSDNPVYEASPALRTEMAAALGGPRGEPLIMMTDEFENALDEDISIKIK